MAQKVFGILICLLLLIVCLLPLTAGATDLMINCKSDVNPDLIDVVVIDVYAPTSTFVIEMKGGCYEYRIKHVEEGLYTFISSIKNKAGYMGKRSAPIMFFVPPAPNPPLLRANLWAS